MKKLITKIAGITAGLAMAIGVGAGIALSNNEKASPVYATDYEYSFTINANDFNTTSYAANNNEKTSIAVCTEDASKTLAVSWTSNQIQKNSTNMQWQKSNGYIYNSTDLGTVNSVTVTNSAGSFTTSYGTAEQPSSGAQGANKGFFKTKVGSATGTTSSVVVNFTISGLIVNYKANGATSGSVPSDANRYDENDLVTVLGNTGSLTKTGYTWNGWNTSADGSGTNYSADATFDISNNITLYARWVKDYSSETNAVITADFLNLNTTGITSEATLFADDGFEYIAAPGGANSVKATNVGGDKAFDGSAKAILMGKKDAYLYNTTAFQKSIARIEIFANSGASTAVSVAVNFASSGACSSSYTTGAKTLSTTNAVYTFNPSILDAKYFRVQVTNANNAQIQIRMVFRIATTNVDVSPASVTLAPGQTQQLTTTITPDNTTDSLTYSTDAPGVATVSDEGLITAVADGTANITATSGTLSDTCVVTVETPEDPFINPAKNSTSGYTGQNETLSFTYGNLTSTLYVISSNESVVTVDDPSTSDGSGTVQINFVGAGSTTVLFKNGATQLASVSVTVTLSNVTIEDLAAASSVDVGGTLNLGSTITVAPYGTCSNAVTWASSDDSVATVSSSGVVTGVAMGVANITVTSNDFPSATMTCEVTVFEKIDFSSSSYNVTKPESAQSELSTVLVDNYTLNVLNAYHVSPGHKSMMLGNGDLNTTNSLVSNKTPAPAPITKIVFTIKSGSSGAAVYYAALSNTEIKSKVTSSTYSRTGEGEITITADPAANMRYFGISCITEGKNGQVENIRLFYDDPTGVEAVNGTTTRSALAYKYTYDGSLTMTAAAIRFGGLISKSAWDKLDAESEIQGYGVMFAMTDLGGLTIEDKYDIAKDGHTVDEAVATICDESSPIVKNFYHEVSEAMPDTANTEQTKGLLEVHYVWNLFKNISLDSLTTAYTAVAYIRTESGIVFFTQSTASVKSLATALLATDEFDNESLDGSLKYLSDLA